MILKRINPEPEPTKSIPTEKTVEERATIEVPQIINSWDPEKKVFVLRRQAGGTKIVTLDEFLKPYEPEDFPITRPYPYAQTLRTTAILLAHKAGINVSKYREEFPGYMNKFRLTPAYFKNILASNGFDINLEIA